LVQASELELVLVLVLEAELVLVVELGLELVLVVELELGLGLGLLHKLPKRVVLPILRLDRCCQTALIIAFFSLVPP